MLRRKRYPRAVALSWLTFAVVLLAGVVSSSFQPFRNLLPLVPLLCVGAAISICRLHRWLATLERMPRVLALGLVPLTAALLASALAAQSWHQIQQRKMAVDTRVQAIDWLQQHARAGDTILALRELAVLPSEWKRLNATPQVVPWSDAARALEGGSFDYVVAGEPDFRLTPDPTVSSMQEADWKAHVSSLPIAVSFGRTPMYIVPYFWRTKEERILILRGNNR